MTGPVPSLLTPAEGEHFSAGPFDITCRVSGAQSGGAFEMYRLALGPATVDYHVHHTMDETILVLEGNIAFNVAGETVLRPAGSVAFIPRGVHHGFTNPGPDRASVLIVFSPSGKQDEYFRALEHLFAAPSLDTKALAALQKTYDQELIAPGR